ncbi:MAG: hypothetical protein HDR75_01890 [Bacteroides sp.]|nr:hypothetical protein [Bacteroides sp.]
MGTPSLESNPLFPTTTIFIGNGFDLSLGLKSRYIDYFNHTDDNGKKDFLANPRLFLRGRTYIIAIEYHPGR